MRCRTGILKQVPMVAATVFLMLGLTPATARAQGNSGGSFSFGPSYRVYTQNYTLGQCELARVEAHVWVDGWISAVACPSGSYAGSGRCENIKYVDSEALAELSASLCGAWTGTGVRVVRHRDDHNLIFVNDQRSNPLGGMNCRHGVPQECEEWQIYDPQLGSCVPYNSPILVPLTRSQDYHLTSVEGGVKFDMDCNGVPEQTAWTAPNSRLAFLAIDMNHDGKITSGCELVGNRLVAGKDHGWEALSALAPPDTAKLTEGHEVFHRLLLWEDRNHDGVSQQDELQPASNVISEIGLGYVRHNRRDRHGNRFLFQGWASVRTGPGRNPTTSHEDMVERNIKLYDVFFKAQQ